MERKEQNLFSFIIYLLRPFSFTERTFFKNPKNLKFWATSGGKIDKMQNG